MIPIADGIHVDDSHGLAKEGIVHVDTDNPEKATDIANPLGAFALGMEGMREFFNNAETILNETTVMMEERMLQSSDRLAELNQGHVGIVIEQMANSWQEKMATFIRAQEEMWDKQREALKNKLDNSTRSLNTSKKDTEESSRIVLKAKQLLRTGFSLKETISELQRCCIVAGRC